MKAPAPDRSLVRRWAEVYLLAAFAVSALWASSARLGFLALAAITLLMVAVHRTSFAPDDRSESSPIEGNYAEAFVVTLLVALPIIFHLTFTWRQEFPFVGDHDYHLFQSNIAFDFWKTYYLPIAALVVVVFIQLRRRGESWIALGALVTLAALGWTYSGDLSFSVRYPGTFYFLAVPAQAVASVFDWDSPLNALRLTNALSVPVWLLVLRPLLFRKWPDISILPVGVFLFYQKEFAYYFTASYLEPWALILVLLAVEHLVVFRGENAWKVYLIMGFAALIKEQVILVLPFVVVATLDWTALRMKRGPQLLLSMVSAAPFLLYYLLRRRAGVWRTAELAELSQILNGARAGTFVERSWLQFGPSIVLVAAAMAACLLLSLRAIGLARRIYAALLCAALFQVLFFYLDRISLDWTGYPRFHLLPVVLLGGPFIELGRSLALRKRSALVALTVAIVTLNGITLVPALSMLREPDVRRNFSEHHDSPIYFPIHEVLGKDDRSAIPARVKHVRVASNIGDVVPGYRHCRSRIPVLQSGSRSTYRVCRLATVAAATIRPPFSASTFTLRTPERTSNRDRLLKLRRSGATQRSCRLAGPSARSQSTISGSLRSESDASETGGSRAG